jgi:hypothetical protein
MAAGDCTAHHGWLWHSAPAQKTGSRYAAAQHGINNAFNSVPFDFRSVIAFSYVSSSARLLPDLAGNSTRFHRPFSTEDELSYSAWIGNVSEMQSIDGNPHLPVVYDENKARERGRLELGANPVNKIRQSSRAESSELELL